MAIVNKTYRELLAHLQTLSEEELSNNVTVYLSEQDEFYPVSDIYVLDGSDVLDDGHTYLKI